MPGQIRSGKIHMKRIGEGLLAIEGATFNIKDKLKELGCRWDRQSKSWVVADEVNVRRAINKLIDGEQRARTPSRRLCGFCREPGHTQATCAAKRTRELAERCTRGPGAKYMQLRATGHCECSFGPLAETCFRCQHWCCSAAGPLIGDPNKFTAFTCPHHGSGIDQLLNDTRGT
jgi:hypothetical protein